MADYIVEAKSRKDLRNLAHNIRKLFGLENELYFPIVKLLDVLHLIFPDFNYEIVPDSELPEEVHADTDIRTGNIRIKESVYERACNGEGRDRMTITHEFAHYITLCFCGFQLQRNFNNVVLPSYKDPEWQAKCLAGELMVPFDLAKDMSAEQIMVECGVSPDAARYQYKKIQEGRWGP